MQSIYHSLFSSVCQRTSSAIHPLSLEICSLFSGNSSHSDCQSSNTYLFVYPRYRHRESAAEFPLRLTCLGTQIKTISFPSLINSICSSKVFTKNGWSYFIGCSDERISDNIKKRLVTMCEGQKNSSSFRSENGPVVWKLTSKCFANVCLVETAAAVTPSSVFEPSVTFFFSSFFFLSGEGYSVISYR